MASHWTRVLKIEGVLYAPFLTVLLAAGIFRGSSVNIPGQHAKLPAGVLGLEDRYVGGRRKPRPLAAAIISGDSMIEDGIYDGDIVVFELTDSVYQDNNDMLTIEKLGEEGGESSWVLKRVAAEYASSAPSTGAKVEWADGVNILKSSNPTYSPVRVNLGSSW